MWKMNILDKMYKDLYGKYLIIICILSGVLAFGFVVALEKITPEPITSVDGTSFLGWYFFGFVYVFSCLLISFHYIYIKSREYKHGKVLPFNPYKVLSRLDKPLDYASFVGGILTIILMAGLFILPELFSWPLILSPLFLLFSRAYAPVFSNSPELLKLHRLAFAVLTAINIGFTLLGLTGLEIALDFLFTLSYFGSMLTGFGVFFPNK